MAKGMARYAKGMAKGMATFGHLHLEIDWFREGTHIFRVTSSFSCSLIHCISSTEMNLEMAASQLTSRLWLISQDLTAFNTVKFLAETIVK